MTALRRTKIIATLGPSTDDPKVLLELLKAGVDLVRVNFSHGPRELHAERIKKTYELSKKLGRVVGVLADLQGPKIRISRFKSGSVQLKPDQNFILDAAYSEDDGDESIVGLDYKDLPNDVKAGDFLLLDDGRLEFLVERVSGKQIHCRVVIGGTLSNHKGLNRKGGGLSAKALTEKDKEDLRFALSQDIDYVAISFPRTAEDIHEAKALIREANGKAHVIAKIERSEAVEYLDEIIEASDAVMVARGDLGVEIGDAELPGVQKRIIQRTRSMNKAVITATQMMESMIHNSIPTRAEVFDVANAVLDGTDAVMLSAETASGIHPARVVEAMARICLGAEKHPVSQISRHRIESRFNHIDEAIAMATMYTANHMDIKAIVSLTESGSTPLWMSRIRSGIPIFALTRHLSTQRRMSLYRGVYAVDFDITQETKNSVNPSAIKTLVQLGLLLPGDLVILTKGDLMGIHGGTNAMKIIEVQ